MLLAPGHTVLAQEKPADEWRPLPAIIEDGQIYISVKAKETDKLWFVLDTGAPFTVIDEQLAASLGLEVREDADPKAKAQMLGKIAMDPGLTIDGEPAGVRFAAAIPVDKMLSRRVGRRISGILGGDYIGSRVLKIDYEHGRVYEHDIDSFRYTGAGEVIPAMSSGKRGHIYLTALITPLGDQPHGMMLILDTGANGTVSLHPEYARWLELPRPGQTVIESKSSTVYGDKPIPLFLAQRLRVGSFVVNDALASTTAGMPISSSSSGGLLGSDFLERFTLIVDTQRGRIILEPNALYRDPPRKAFSGLAVRADGDDFSTCAVALVAADSPAQRAGFQVDDILTAIDGRAAKDLSFSEIKKILRTTIDKPLKISVSRAGTPQEMTVTSGDITTWLKTGPKP